MERMKRVVSMFLAVVTLITACPVSAFAVEASAAGEDGIGSYADYQYSVLSDGTISI